MQHLEQVWPILLAQLVSNRALHYIFFLYSICIIFIYFIQNNHTITSPKTHPLASITTHLLIHFIQNERSFQKQDAVSLNKLRRLGHQTKKGSTRYYHSVGLGFKTPREAIVGHYVDKKCPFTGNVSIRGHLLRGVVQSTAMNRTIVIRRDYLHFRPKYQRYEKRHKTLSVHCSPCFEVHKGDMVIAGQCRFVL